MQNLNSAEKMNHILFLTHDLIEQNDLSPWQKSVARQVYKLMKNIISFKRKEFK